MTVQCTNQTCTEYQIPKTGADFPIADITCGECGGTVVETAEEETTE